MPVHIPTKPTAQQQLLPFDEALEAALQPNGQYDAARWLYVPNAYGDYRYILGTRGERPLICAGLNPSTAAPDRLDNTLKSVERIALANGYDSFLMFNLYAQRATRPDDMERQPNLWLHQQNMRAFSWLLRQGDGAPAVWAAWGAVMEKRSYLAGFVRELGELGAEAGARWLHAGPLSRKGHPHHPLYLPKTSRLEPFDLAAYLAALP